MKQRYRRISKMVRPRSLDLYSLDTVQEALIFLSKGTLLPELYGVFGEEKTIKFLLDSAKIEEKG